MKKLNLTEKLETFMKETGCENYTQRISCIFNSRNKIKEENENLLEQEELWKEWEEKFQTMINELIGAKKNATYILDEAADGLISEFWEVNQDLKRLEEMLYEPERSKKKEYNNLNRNYLKLGESDVVTAFFEEEKFGHLEALNTLQKIRDETRKAVDAQPEQYMEVIESINKDTKEYKYCAENKNEADYVRGFDANLEVAKKLCLDNPECWFIGILTDGPDDPAPLYQCLTQCKEKTRKSSSWWTQWERMPARDIWPTILQKRISKRESKPQEIVHVQQKAKKEAQEEIPDIGKIGDDDDDMEW